ncbi:tetratricopeptide repeat protein [Sphingobium sp. AP49]|uniref:tol-pal system YbgF family protein n=1 Tax=Sphingobium sp. AP49 TaxID=1144307 RepID=UPI000A31396E|nr:tetratricopeptide repeat protein [Sphingobium sp. AP49]WHO41151.1 tetratricopeptide repeat protein [Sphingobium sp. AP49]
MRRVSILTFGLPVALAGAMLLAGPASAKKKIVVAGPPIQMSDAFRADVQAAEAAIKARDASTANLRIATLSPTTDFEAYVAAGLRFETAVLRRDVQAQRIALTDMFKTSSVPKTDAPRLRFVAAYLSYTVGNYADAVAQLDYAKTLGYDGLDATMLRADIAMRKGKPKDARPFVQEALARQKASGQPIPAAWYDRAISMAYQAGDWNEVSSLYRERLETYPSTPEWRSALINYLAGQENDAQVQLDLYRLQAANGAMASERDYQAYAQLAEKTGNFAEAKAIIEAGRAAGKLTTTQATTAQLLKAVTPKATKDIAAMPALAKKAAAAKDGKAALDAADAYFSLGQYPQAVEQYRAALSKGGVDEGRANARLGIAMARSGDLTGAKTTLAQVNSGGWSNVAGFWSVWVDLQNRKSAQQNAAPTAG